MVVDPEAAAVRPVDGQLGADGAAEEGAGGHAQRLAHHVQQGVLDGRDGLRDRARGLLQMRLCPDQSLLKVPILSRFGFFF